MASNSAQYSSVKSLVSGDQVPAWVPEGERDRVASYQRYDNVYWSQQGAFALARRGSEIKPIYVPDGSTIVDTTAHFLLKGLTITTEKGEGKRQDSLDKFLKREKFYSRFLVAKHAGVAWGDWVIHVVADPAKPEGKRVSMLAVDPAQFFPTYDDNDLTQMTSASLAYGFTDIDGKVAVHKLTYDRVPGSNGEYGVSRREGIFNVDTENKWADPEQEQSVLKKVVLKEERLPDEITEIPIYHFKNQDWQGELYGSSELRGYERILASVNQAISDNELALALEGLGVYASDGGSPVDSAGNAVDWEIAPGRVVEVPSGAYFKRVEGLTSVTPSLDHVKFLEEAMWRSSGTFYGGDVEVNVAASGISLAIHFLPMMAKLEARDVACTGTLEQLWSDWTAWQAAYEGDVWSDADRESLQIKLGDKLPINIKDRIAELNNMLDRHVISRKFYRQEMTKLTGMTFPDDIDEQVQAEREADQEFERGTEEDPAETLTGQVDAQGRPLLSSGDPANPNAPTMPKRPNQSNNRKRVNESNGTEVGQRPGRQRPRVSA